MALASPDATNAATSIAAAFQACVDCYCSLCAAKGARLSSSPDISSWIDDSRIRLFRWGHRTGSATKALDYVIRRSSELRDAIVELLTSLREALERSASSCVLHPISDSPLLGMLT